MKHTWDENYIALKEYSELYKTTRVPQKLVYKGFSLGAFVGRCRQSHQKGVLSEDKIEKLKTINFSFDPYGDDWNKAYSYALQYYEEYGDLLVKQDEEYQGFKLGAWISNQRASYYNSNRKITNERIELLEKIGMIWNANEAFWEIHYNNAKKYYDEFGNLDIPISLNYNGLKLGRWISNQRNARNILNDSHILTSERIKKLDKIGMLWESLDAKKSSFPEQVLFYYFKKIFPDATSNDRSLGFEVDVLDKETGIGIEYDGRFYHQNLQRDLDKNLKANKIIELYRIREKGCPILMDKLSQNIIIEKVDNYSYLSTVYQKVLDSICIKTGRKCINVDIYRDMDDILKLYKNNNDKFEIWMNEAEKYYNLYGDLQVQCTDHENRSLYLFLERARAAYHNKKGKITKKNIERLNKLGMIWDVKEYYFETKYMIAKRYYEENGDLMISKNTVIDNVDMGNFITVLRRSYKENKLDKLKVKRMEEIGMVWSPRDENWEKNYAILKELYKNTGTINISATYTINNVHIGKWLHNQRLAYWKVEQRYLDDYRIKKLEELNIDWKEDKYSKEYNIYKEEQWLSKYKLLHEFIDIYGIEQFNTKVDFKGVHIGAWVSRQRMNDKLSNEKKEMLSELGIKMNCFEETWLDMFKLVKEYTEIYGWSKLKQTTRYKGKNIGKWVDTRRQEKRGRRGVEGTTLTDEKIELLDSIGIVWNMLEDKWMQHYSALKEFLKEHCWDEVKRNVSYNGIDIGGWVSNQRMLKNGTAHTGHISEEQIKMLENLGISWKPIEENWCNTYYLVKEYTELYGWENLKYKTEYKNVKIGVWISRHKAARKGTCGRFKINEERIEMLNKIGMKW